MELANSPKPNTVIEDIKVKEMVYFFKITNVSLFKLGNYGRPISRRQSLQGPQPHHRWQEGQC